MPPEPGESNLIPNLLACLADPAAVVDADGRLVAWNDAAAARFGLGAGDAGTRPEERLRRWQGGARRIALADGAAGALIAWSLDDDGLGPDEVAISKATVVGRISGSALHEINNALTIGIGLGGLIATDRGVPADLRDMARDLEAEGQRAQALAHGFLEFSRNRPARTAHIKLGPLLHETFDVLGHAAVNMNPRLTVPPMLPEVEADEGLLRHALYALLVNAFEAQGATWERGATPVAGRIIVTASVRDDANGHRVRIAIEDGAPPVPEEERAGLFTGGASRSSQDLLAARVLVARLGGRLSHETAANGNRIVLELPVAGTTLPAVTPAAAAAGPPAVLVCDDDVFIRSLLVRMMQKRGFEALEARSGEHAMEVLRTREVALVVADVHMPDLSGPALYEAATASHPAMASRFIFTTGNPAEQDVIEFMGRTGARVLAKPFDSAQLDALIRAALES